MLEHVTQLRFLSFVLYMNSTKLPIKQPNLKPNYKLSFGRKRPKFYNLLFMLEGQAAHKLDPSATLFETDDGGVLVSATMNRGILIPDHRIRIDITGTDSHYNLWKNEVLYLGY